jgi:hypothetical protein
MTGAQNRRVLRNNDFGELADSTEEKFDPKEILHLVINAKLNPDGLFFYLTSAIEKPIQISEEKDLIDYLMGLYDKSIQNTFVVPSPLDIDVKKQCWVVVQLSGKIDNWQFMKGDLGCTTKSPGNDRNIKLRHIYNDKIDPIGDVGGIVRDEKCKILCFGVRRRGRLNSTDPQNPGRDAFNFHIEFLPEKGDDKKKRLKVIFDPDVKNDSDNNPIPPDGG